MSKLTLRHVKKNKRRTLVTIIGVIISAAMLSAVSTLIVSFLDIFQRSAIQSSGEWHVLYEDVYKEQIEKIAKDEETKEFFIHKDFGYASLENSQNKNKPFLFVSAFNEQGFKNFPIKLLKGRLPQAENEIIISEAIGANANVHYQIGDELTLEIGNRIDEQSGEILHQDSSLHLADGKLFEKLTHETTKKYKVVGVIERPNWEPSWAPGYTVISYIDEHKLSADDTVHTAVVVKNIKRSLFKHAEQLADKNNIESVTFNNELLRYYGVIKNDMLRTTLYSFSAIIMGIIVIGSVSLIYNSFAISVSERSRHLGMLSSVGATKKQKRNSVFFEGAVIGLISIPIGILSGIAGIAITFYFINPILQNAIGTDLTLNIVVTPWSILIACLVAILTIFISTYLPAIRASKITAIDAIRQTEDVKLTSKAVKTSKLVRKIFGIEAEIGLKNLKRNKRRYMATVFSLVISIILFLSVTYFTDSLKKSASLTQLGVNFDISIAQGGQTSEQWERLIDGIQSIDEITEISQVEHLVLTSWVDKTAIADEIDVDSNILKNGKFPYYVYIYALDETNLKTYAKDIDVDLGVLSVDSGKLPAIVIDTVPYRDMERDKRVETKAIHTEVGKTLDLVYRDWDKNKNIDIGQIEVAALTDKEPFGVTPSEMGNVNIIVSKQVMDQLIKKMEPSIREKLVNESAHENYLFLKTTDPNATQDKIEKMKEVEIFIFNAYQIRQQDEQMILLMSVFTYGFITLITLISMANIFNTISTSIQLRKREFAMLKSVGMTPKGFNKMINYESIFYGIKALLYGLPLSIGAMYLMHYSLMNSFEFTFKLPWLSILYVVIGIFIIVGSAMLYSSSKVKKENIIESLKQENI